MVLRTFVVSMLSGLCLFLGQSIGLPSYVQAENQEIKEDSISAEYTADDYEQFFLRMNLVLPATKAASVLAMGKSILVPVEVKGELTALGEDVDISTTVEKSVFVVAKKFVLDGQLEEDLQFIGDTIYLDSDARVQKDVKIEAHRASLGGEIGGNLYGKADRVMISGIIKGDAFIDAEKIVVDKNARIQGQLYYARDARLRIKEGAYVPSKGILDVQQKEILLNALQTAPEHEQAQIRYQKFIQGNKQIVDFFGKHDKSISGLRLAFWGLVLFGVGYLLFRRFPLFMQKAVTQSSGISFLGVMGHGLVGIIVIPFVIFLLMITIVGIPVALLLVLFYILYLFLSKVLGIWTISQRVWYGMQGNSEKSAQKYSLLAFLIGIVLISVICAIPMVGWLLGFLVLLLGSGILWRRLWNRTPLPSSFTKVPVKKLK